MERTKRSLSELKTVLERDGIRFTVLLMPIPRAYEDWVPREKASREMALRVLDELDIRHFDLMRATGITERDVVLTDRWHPGESIAQRFADFLYNKELLETVVHGTGAGNQDM